MRLRFRRLKAPARVKRFEKIFFCILLFMLIFSKKRGRNIFSCLFTEWVDWDGFESIEKFRASYGSEVHMRGWWVGWLKRRDYELIIISRLLVYGSVYYERVIHEVGLTLSFADEEWRYIEMLLEVFKRGEVPVRVFAWCVCWLEWGDVINETLGVRWDGDGFLHMYELKRLYDKCFRVWDTNDLSFVLNIFKWSVLITVFFLKCFKRFIFAVVTAKCNDVEFYFCIARVFYLFKVFKESIESVGGELIRASHIVKSSMESVFIYSGEHIWKD